jgi:hypothetical protein
MFRSSLASLVADGGQFNGMMDEMSQTFEGATTRLKGSLEIALAELGESILPLATEAINNFNGIITSINWSQIGADIVEIARGFAEFTNWILQSSSAMNGLSNSMGGMGIFSRYMKDSTQVAKENELQLEKNRLKILEWSGNGAEGVQKVSKALTGLGDKLADIDQQLAKQNESYLDSLKSIETKKLDSIMSLEKQLQKEEQTFTKSQQKKQKDLESFEKKKRETLNKTLEKEKENYKTTIQQIEENLSKELNSKDRNSEESVKLLEQVLADEKKLYEEKTNEIIKLAEEEIAEKQLAFNEETAEIKAEYNERTEALKMQLQEEKDFLIKHQEELSKVKDRILLDEVEKAKKAHMEALQRLEEQKTKSISSANESSGNYRINQKADTQALIEESKKRIEQLEKEAKTVQTTQKSLAETFKESLFNFFVDLGRMGDEAMKKIEDSVKLVGSIALNVIKENANNLIVDPINDFLKDPVLKTILGGKTPQLPRLATGTANFEGGMARVGENGPENVILPKGSKVIPASQSVNDNKQVTINNYFPPQTDYNLFSSRTSFLLNRI